MADGHLHLVNDVVNGDKNAIKFMKKGNFYDVVTYLMKFNTTALGRMEELVTEMKNDVNKLPAELVKLPCVTKQLNLSAYNILSKLANQKTPGISKTEQHKITATTTIVKVSTTTTAANTTATTTTASSNVSTTTSTHKSSTSVIQQTLNKYIASTKTSKSSNVQPSTTMHSYALQTAGGSLLLYNAGGGGTATQNTATQYIVSGNATGAQQFALAPSTGGSSGSARHTQYIQGTDGNLYAITTRPSQGQNLVLSTSQGVIYWPVQSNTTQTTAIIPQQSQQQYASTAAMPGSAVIAKENSKGKLVPTAITVATPVTSNATTKTIVVPSTSTATQVSVITID